MYVKLFSSIYQGTLRGNAHGLLVFTNLLAHADQDGVVDIHPRAIAEEVGLTQDEVRAALHMLESPDPESRSPADEGRRISRIDEHRSWGWEIVNYAKYAAIRKAEDRRQQVAEAVKRHRARKGVIISNHEKAHEIKSNHTKAKKAHIDTDIDTDSDISINVPKEDQEDQNAQDAQPQTGEPEPAEQLDRANQAKQGVSEGHCEDIYTAYPRHDAKKKALAAIKRAIERHDPARILAQTRAYARRERATEKKYIPFAEKWFDEERYLDQDSPTVQQIDQSAEQLEKAIQDGELMFKDNVAYGTVMSRLTDNYGSLITLRATKAKGWRP